MKIFPLHTISLWFILYTGINEIFLILRLYETCTFYIVVFSETVLSNIENINDWYECKESRVFLILKNIDSTYLYQKNIRKYEVWVWRIIYTLNSQRLFCKNIYAGLVWEGRIAGFCWHWLIRRIFFRQIELSRFIVDEGMSEMICLKMNKRHSE